jgi:hypothetical protein
VLAFVHIPKTGGSTVKFVLRNTFGIRHCDARACGRSQCLHPDDLALARRVHPGLRSIAGHSLIHPTGNLEGVAFHTFLRDPVTRIASAYAHHLRGNRRRRRGEPALTLEQFLARDRPGGWQTYQVSGGSDPEKAKAILRDRFLCVGLMERFDESLAILAALCPHPLDTRYERRNASPKDDPVKRSVLEDPANRALVEGVNRSDRILYDWVVATLYPELLARAMARAGPAFGAAGEAEVDGTRVLLSRGWNKGVFRPLQKAAHALGLRPRPGPVAG